MSWKRDLWMRGMTMAAAAVLALADAPLAAGQEPVTEAELSGGWETLSGGREAWNDQRLRLSRRTPGGDSFGGEVQRTERFGLSDVQIGADAGVRLGAGWAGAIMGSVSPSAEVLPRYSLGTEVGRDLGGGWQAGVGGRVSEYESGLVRVATVLVDRYVGAFRVGYRLNAGFVEGEVAPAHQVSLSRYYGEGASITALAGAGEAVERTSPTTLLATSSRFAAVWGVHWLTDRAGLSYAASYSDLVDVFERYRLEAGVRLRW